MKNQRKHNIDGGLNLVKYAFLQYNYLYIDKKEGCDLLKVEPDDIKKAIKDSAVLSYKVLKKEVKVIDMKKE